MRAALGTVKCPGAAFLCVEFPTARITRMYEYSVQLIQIVDGDTLKLDVDCGFHLHLRQTFRLARINAPERLTVQGVQAKAFVVDQLSGATAMKIFSQRSEKYGRWLCEFYFQTKNSRSQWINLNSLMLTAGHALPYRHR